MIPITRKELYLNKIVGNDDYSVPEKPISEEEFFFAEILGEAVQAPEPLTRYQIYLAKIAGRNIEIPYPETRLEYFLAKAAGMDITVPVPITREEIYWSNYTAIVEFEVEGVPPLSYKALAAGTLENYRIFGNTVGGESVGDRTGNLFDMKTFAETAYPQNATVNYSENSLIFTATQIDAYVNQVYAQINIPVALRSSCINVQPLTTYTISMNAPYKCFISWINDSFNPVANYTKIPNNQTSYTFTTPSNCTKLLIRLGKDVTNIGDTFTISNIMLNTGSTALPYEPYGYKVPVTINDVTTNLYLPEPIKMVGDEAEYVDYAEQKMHRARKNLLNIETDIVPLGFQHGTVTIFNDLNVKGFFKECEPNTAYTISRKTSSNNNRFSIGFSLTKPKNGSTQSLLDYTTPLDTLATSLTLTSPAGARYVCCYLSNINEDITPDMEIMLEKNDYATDYEPYIENTDLDVTLPALPTLPETNVLSVGTEVQPSKVYIKGEKERE